MLVDRYYCSSLPPARGFTNTLCDPLGFVKIDLYITLLTPRFWSLPYDILSYAMASLILASRSWVLIYLAVAGVGTCVFLFLYGLKFNPSDSLFVNLLLQEFLIFSIGATAYYFLHRIPVVPSRIFAAAIIIMTLAVMATRLYIGKTNICSNLLTSLLTLFVLKNLPDILAKSRFNLGYVSYSLYIFHYTVIMAIGSFVFHTWGVL